MWLGGEEEEGSLEERGMKIKVKIEGKMDVACFQIILKLDQLEDEPTVIMVALFSNRGRES